MILKKKTLKFRNFITSVALCLALTINIVPAAELTDVTIATLDSEVLEMENLDNAETELEALDNVQEISEEVPSQLEGNNIEETSEVYFSANEDAKFSVNAGVLPVLEGTGLDSGVTLVNNTITVSGTKTLTDTVFIGEGEELIVAAATSGGTIKRGTAATDAMFYVSGGSLTLKSNIVLDGNGTAMAEGSGAIIYLESGEVTINGCTLKNNKSNDYGGAICLVDGQLNSYGSNTITGNSALAGGGVYVGNGIFNMASIVGNTNPTLSISDNKAEEGGAGVYFDGAGEFSVINTVTISNNKTTGGENSNVYLGSGAFIGLKGALTSTSKINVRTADYPEKDMPVLVAKGKDGGSYTATSNDMAKFASEENYEFSLNDGEIFINVSGAPNLSETGLASYLSGKILTINSNVKLLSAIVIGEDEELTIKGTGKITLDKENFDSSAMIDIQDGGKLIVEGVTIEGAGSDFENLGPIISILGEESDVTLNNAILQNNNNVYGAGAVEMYEGTFTMKGTSTIKNNIGATQGGVCLMGGAFNMAENSSIASNTAIDMGGGIYVSAGSSFNMKDNSSIKNNMSYSFGGGLYCEADANFSVKDSIQISDNKITIDEEETINDDAYLCFDAFINIAGKLNENAKITVSSENEPDEGNQVTIAVGSGEYKITNSDIQKLLANGSYDLELDEINNAINLVPSNAPSLTGTGLENYAVGNTVEINGIVILKAPITISAGQELNIKGLDGKIIKSDDFEGNMFELSEDAALYIEGVTIDGNKEVEGDGSIIFVSGDGSSVTLKNAKLINNISLSNGSAISASGESVINMLGTSEISSNLAELAGGAIDLQSGSILNMKDSSKISNNESSSSGGGVNAGFDSIINMQDNSVITGNTSLETGGGICLEESAILNMQGSSSIVSNKSEEEAGGVYVSYGSQMHIQESANVSQNASTALGKDNVYLCSGSTLVIDAALSQTANINIRTEMDPEEDDPIIVAVGEDYSVKRTDAAGLGSDAGYNMLYSNGEIKMIFGELPPPEKGDVNGNGWFDSGDVSLIMEMIIDGYTEDQITQADYDSDGKITINDAISVMKAALND